MRLKRSCFLLFFFFYDDDDDDDDSSFKVYQPRPSYLAHPVLHWDTTLPAAKARPNPILHTTRAVEAAASDVAEGTVRQKHLLPGAGQWW